MPIAAPPPRMSASDQSTVLAGAPVASFTSHLAAAGLPALRAEAPDILQVNVGKLCNQTCSHCHVDAGPHQKAANMSWPTFEAVLDLVRALRPRLVDITGGAPELNAHFRRFVMELRALGVAEIIDRCNLTVLQLKSQQDLAEFLAEQRVHVVASLPAVNERQTDAQRGDGIFQTSLAGLQRLNAVGYARGGNGLELTLMSNPGGAFLPPPQEASEARFRRLLHDRHGIAFTRLIQLTNMPISRFLEWLLSREGRFEDYLNRLSRSFNAAAVPGLMCRTTLSIAWDGSLHDCDFNQMLEIPIAACAGRTVFDLRLEALAGRAVRVGKHCLGCTAGQGSSCGGATA